MGLLRRPFEGSLSSYVYELNKKMGHWSPGTESSPVRSFSLILCMNELMLREIEEILDFVHVLYIIPIEPSWAKQCTSDFMIKPAAAFCVPGYWR